MTRFLVAIPVFNEERYVRGVVGAVRRHAPHVLVVDDGSSDRTPEILAELGGVHVIRHGRNRGYGQSMIDAIRYAARQGFDWLITLDCDEQHEPARIPDFVREARRDDADIISGSRYLLAHPDDDEPPADRRRINQTINLLLEQTLGLQLSDSFCGFKALRVSAVAGLELDEAGYAFPLQFWVQAARAGLRVRELPVRRIYADPTRTFGGSLDDASSRLVHYVDVFLRAMRRPAPESVAPSASVVCGLTQTG
ncbi:MAG: glycosyltransferase family 2 protein [Phycisphaerales bacterium]|nr:glycosyltransferase family 2 protein [Phycisphaerales bacterium]